MNGFTEEQKALLQRCEMLHGHVGAGVLRGFRAALYAKETLGLDPSGKDAVCVAEDVCCPVDAVQAVLGCTSGKGNLLFRMTGKQAFSFYNRTTGKSLRLVLRPKPEDLTEEDELYRYYQQAEPKDLFDVKETMMALPDKPEPVGTVMCDGCGELTAEPFIHPLDGKNLCADCYQSGIGARE